LWIATKEPKALRRLDVEPELKHIAVLHGGKRKRVKKKKGQA
jgi:hypothetical protein